MELCRRLGLETELLPTNEALRGAEVVSRGKLHRVPEGFMLMVPHDAWAVWRSPLLSWRGKLRLLAESLVPRRDSALSDESLKSFATRRLGREAFERLVQPLVSGIYTADAAQLSMAAALPKFWKMEREHGSLLRAAWKERKKESAEAAGSGARYSLFNAPRLGMRQIIDAVAALLPADCVRLNSPVLALTQRAERWNIAMADGSSEEFDAVIVATPAMRAATVLRGLDAELATELAAIPYAGAAIALVGCSADQIGRAPRSFGFVVPEVEGRQILAASFSSLKFPGRAPDGEILIRVFLGGAARPDLLDKDDAEIRQIVLRELGELIQLRGEPRLFQVRRWPAAMPQYHVGHLDRLAKIEVAVGRYRTLALAGNAYRGVGIPQCVASGNRAAEKIAAAFGD